MRPDSQTTHALPCCVEAPAHVLPGARYALQMLLFPLGIRPVWTSRDGLGGGLYYGLEPAAAPPGALALPLQAETCRYFESFDAYPAGRVTWRAAGETAYPVLFGGPAPENDDLVASAFFWLSGWQEYTISNRDQHGRFPYTASLQHALEIAGKPAVDQYRTVLQQQLAALGVPVAPISWGGSSWAFCVTHDIDYLRKWRPGMVYRETVERLLFNSAGEGVSRRLRRFGQFTGDFLRPGDVFRKAFRRMVAAVDARGGRATYFLKTGAHGPHDVFYPPKSAFLRRMIALLKEKDFTIGLHPSYYAHAHAGYLLDEKRALEDAVQQPVTAIRQHYLRYAVPQTPRLQEDAGFTIDSTLAFAGQEGFRNATCFPFLRYDVLKNEATPVWEMPLCFMDGSLFNYRRLSTDEAIRVTKKLIETCQAYGGVCVGLWHNTLWDEMDFPGWGVHFEAILDEAAARNGALLTLEEALGSFEM